MWLNPETSNLAPKGTFEEEQTMLSVPPKNIWHGAGKSLKAAVNTK
jgi:hypothetical protein